MKTAFQFYEGWHGLSGALFLWIDFKLMRSIFRVAPTGIGVISNRVLHDVNALVCEMTGYAREELIGKSAEIFCSSQAARNQGTFYERLPG